jgi:hypothetical protein
VCVCVCVGVKVNGEGGECSHCKIILPSVLLFKCNDSSYRVDDDVCPTNGNPWCRNCLLQTQHRWCLPEDHRHKMISKSHSYRPAEDHFVAALVLWLP